jgi:hypothetical protein
MALSREAVVPGPDGDLLVAGGLTAANNANSWVWSIDPRTGRGQHDGSLTVPVHDAGAAALSAGRFVFGGGVTNSDAAVQELAPARA